ncbi:MAG: glycoside hydrolase family 127 protein [Acidobacteria bacterium]|nr:glycoside hydrolase family 127 protein [Acidobacteriota bacterium]
MRCARLVTGAILALVCPAPAERNAQLAAVPAGAARWTKGFWAERFALAHQVMAPEMRKTLDLAGNGANLVNLRIAADMEAGAFQGNAWSDGDVFKWLEGMAHFYARTRDAKIDAEMDAVIAIIARAQQADGYLSTNITLRGQPRWTEPRRHEMYNMGHLLAAAAAHFKATGKRSLLAVAERVTSYLYSLLSPRPAAMAHFGAPSNAMGFVDLYRATGDKRLLELAAILVDSRGSAPGGTDHFQTRVPLRKETQAVGHAVHATYLYATAADLVAETGDAGLRAAVERIWDDVAGKRVYITGAVGPLDPGLTPRRDIAFEAFGADYELPNRRGYNETCANIGNALWNWRMLAMSGEARYADAWENILYNSMLSGAGLDGRSFFYANVHRRYAGEAPLLRNETLVRWHDTVQKPSADSYCCPPNLLRMIASLDSYAYGVSSDAIWVNLYGGSRLDALGMQLEQESEYPWDGQVTFRVRAAPRRELGLKLRIPGWSGRNTLRLNGRAEAAPAAGRYVELRRQWKAGDTVVLTLDMKPRLMIANPLLETSRNQVAVMRGPLVYCLESPDVPAGVRVSDVTLSRRAAWKIRHEGKVLGGIDMLETEAKRYPQAGGSSLYLALRPAGPEPVTIRLIPYYAWANRGISHMTVWIPLSD